MSRAPGSANASGPSSDRLEHRSLEAEADQPARGRDHAAEAGAVPAGHPGLQRELGWARCAARTAPAPPRASAAARRRNLGVRAGVELGAEQLGDQAVMAVCAVVGGHPGLVQQSRPGGMGGIAKAEQRPACRRPGRPATSASGAIPTPPPHSTARRPSRGGREATAERADERQGVAGPRARTGGVVPGPTSSSRNCSVPARRPQHAERARQVGPLAGAPSPPASRPSACRTDPGSARALAVVAGEHHVGAVLGAAGHRHDARPEGRDDAVGERAARTTRGSRLPRDRRAAEPCSSCRETTLGSPGLGGADRAGGGHAAGDRGDAGDPAGDRGRADLVAVRARAGPIGVLMTRSTSPRSIQSTTCGGPSPILLISSAGMPIRRSACAVPRVAMIAEAKVMQQRGDPGRRQLVVIGDGQEHGAGLAAAPRRRRPAPWRTRSGSPARSPSPRRSSASRGRAASRRRRSG